MKTNKRFILLTAVLCVAGMLAMGCAKSNQKAKETAAADTGYGTVTIQNGSRTLVFSKMPERVIAFNSYVTENMLVLGLGDKIAATYVMSPGNSPLKEYEAEYRKIPEITRSHEIALGYNPDFVAGQVSSFTDKAWGTVEMFADKGIASYIISGTLAENETIDNIYEDLENLGKIFKVEDRAGAVIAQMKAKVGEITGKSGGIRDKARVFVMDSFNGNEIYTTSKGLQSQLIELAGGINVTKNEATSRWFNTSVETLVDRNPDIIIFNEYGAMPSSEKIAFIDGNRALQDVPAVKNKRYIVIPLQDVMQDVRAANTVETFARAFYPELF